MCYLSAGITLNRDPYRQILSENHSLERAEYGIGQCGNSSHVAELQVTNGTDRLGTHLKNQLTENEL